VIQWHAVVPRESEAALGHLLATLRHHDAVSPLVSVKGLGASNRGHLSFPMSGWTIAIDLPAATRDLAALLERLDAITAEAGGRQYLAKDSRLRSARLRAMYPQLAEWCAVRESVDPSHVMCSDLARRLHLVEAAG
jgi:decaprenylphospho-beta-D-ribofuranose 2-oxidase